MNMFWLVVSAALADSVNPCEIGILTMALLYIMFAYGKDRIQKIGFTFTAGIFVSYYTYGVLMSYLFGYVKYIRVIVGIAAIVLASIRMYYALRNQVVKMSPPPLRPIIANQLRKNNAIHAFLGGLLGGLVLMPCSSGPYYVILAAIQAHDLQAYLWLLLYNAIVILPLLAVTVVTYFFGDVLRDNKYMPVLEWASSLMLLALGLYVLTQF